MNEFFYREITMKAKLSFGKTSYSIQNLFPIILFVVSLLAAILSGIFLFNNSLMASLSAIIISMGLDPMRSQFIAALVMTMGAALIGAGLGRSKLAGVIGASAIFWFRYLNDFIQLELRPTFDPGGHLEPLDSGVLLHTSFIMMALALLSALLGAAAGVALGEVFLDPPYQLVRALWRHLQRSRNESTAPANYAAWPSTRLMLVQQSMRWLGLVIMIIAIALASSSGPLFLFSPDIGMHTAPPLPRVKTNAQSPTAPPVHSVILQDNVMSAALHGQRKPFMVYLPPSYNTPEGKTRRYPVLYLLHGSPGSDHDWIVAGRAAESADTLIATGKISDLIMIMPDGNGRPGATSEWGNSFDQRQLMETYVVNDLVQYVDQHYRTIADPAHRAIGGLSMGGFGAMNIAVHHPDVFGTVISLGGYYYAEGGIWGNNTNYIAQNSPAIILPHTPQAWKLHIYLGAASKDQPYYTDTKRFMLELDTLHILYHFDLQNGFHSWRVWQIQMYNAFLWLKWDS